MADWTDLIAPLLGTAGSIYSSNQAANATTNAANQAAQAAQFRPVGVTTRFGKSGFQYDPASGQLIGAGYQVAPDIAAMREGLIGMAGTGLGSAQGVQAFQPQVNTAAQGLFNLGQSYIGQNPQQVAQNWLTQQQQLLAPGREQQLAQLTNQQQQQGRLGLATGGTRAGYTVNQPQQGMMNPSMAGTGFDQMSRQDSTAIPNYGMQSQAPKTEADWNRFSEMASFAPGANMDQIKANFMSGGGGRSGYGGPTLGAVTAAGSSAMPQQSSFMPTGGQNYASQGLQATNPQMAAYYNAMAQQDAQLAAQAQQAGQQQVTFGQGLMTGGLGLSGAGYNLQNTALSPYTNYLAGATGLENQGMNALTQGSALGSSITAGSTNAANLQNQAAQQAAQLQLARNNAVVGGLTDPISALIGSLTGGGGSSGGVNYNAVVNPYFQTNL